MQNSREDSVWRTLAVAFGDGLAFGVGMNLTRNAVRLAAGKTAPEIRPLAERINAIEQRIDRARASGTLPAPQTLDSRMADLGAKFERSLAELEVKVRIQLDALEQQDRGLRDEVAEQMASLRSQVVTLHKEFAEAVSQLVEERIEHEMAERLGPIEQTLREVIREEAERASAAVAAATEEYVNSRLDPMREENAARDGRIAELERRLEGRDRNMLELVLALGQTCLQTAERIAEPEAPPAGAGGAGGPAGETTIGAADLMLPSFARPRPKAVWRIPFVPSFVVLTCGLLVLHYL